MRLLSIQIQGLKDAPVMCVAGGYETEYVHNEPAQELYIDGLLTRIDTNILAEVVYQ